jgi:hypothetical protein|tara:strand:+ start:1126 stop:1284 length:159 start_codon:yes stop_codon:yes gene_type:complete
MKNIKKKLFTLVLLMGLAVTFIGCWNVCDETVYGTNPDGTTYEECVVYNNNQ